MGGMPIHQTQGETHSQAQGEILDFVFSRGIPNGEGVKKLLLGLMDDPHLHTRIDTHTATASNRPAAVSASSDGPNNHTENERFGNVHSKMNRWDFRLRLDPIVSSAVEELMGHLAPLVKGTHAGSRARLCELSAIVSDPGSFQQPLHADTQIGADEEESNGPDPKGSTDTQDESIGTRQVVNHIVSLFVALQPVDPAMGPTRIVPASHNKASHLQLEKNAGGSHEGDNEDTSGDGNETARDVHFLSRKLVYCTCDVGDVVMMDSRLLHCGAANVSPRRRVLLYLSFIAEGAQHQSAYGSTLSLLSKYVGLFGIDDLMRNISNHLQG